MAATSRLSQKPSKRRVEAKEGKDWVVVVVATMTRLVGWLAGWLTEQSKAAVDVQVEAAGQAVGRTRQ